MPLIPLHVMIKDKRILCRILICSIEKSIIIGKEKKNQDEIARWSWLRMSVICPNWFMAIFIYNFIFKSGLILSVKDAGTLDDGKGVVCLDFLLTLIHKLVFLSLVLNKMPNQLHTSIYLYQYNTDIEEREIPALETIMHSRFKSELYGWLSEWFWRNYINTLILTLNICNNYED